MSSVRYIDEKQRVPVLVFFCSDDKNTARSRMEFYALDPSIFCPIGDQHWSPVDNDTPRPLKDVPFRALPFAGISSCPLYCSFVSVGDQFYIIGGTPLSHHVMQQRHVAEIAAADDDDDDYDYNEVVDEEDEEYAKYLFSNRVKCFEFQRFLNSFGDKQVWKCEFAELDEVSNDYSTFWKTCPSMSVGTTQPHLWHLGGKLYAFGFHGGLPAIPSVIQVFDLAKGVWTSLASNDPLDIGLTSIVSAAIEHSNTILIGSSNNSFYELDVGNGEGEARWKKIDGWECPTPLIRGCSSEPGFVIFNCFVLWYDHRAVCIKGLSFFRKENMKYFTVKLLGDILVPEDEYGDDYTTKLIDLGKGTLGLIYRGTRWYDTLDENDEKYYLCEYHYATFEIDFISRYHYFVADESLPFPGVQLKTRLISRHKCYAPEGSKLGAAFAMDPILPN